MPLAGNRKIPANPFFIIPFLLWFAAGALLLLFFSRKDLFFTPNTNFSDWANVFMFYTTWLGQGEVIILVLVLLMLYRPFRNWWYFTTALVCNLVPFFAEQILKTLFDRPRPRLLFYDRLWMHYLPEWPVYLSRSFPSGHSTGAFSFFCFLSLILTARYKAFGLLFFLLALSVCYSRMYLAAHFFDDVYAGSLLGTTLTMLMFSIMNQYKSKFFKKNLTA